MGAENGQARPQKQDTYLAREARFGQKSPSIADG